MKKFLMKNQRVNNICIKNNGKESEKRVNSSEHSEGQSTSKPGINKTKHKKVMQITYE